MAGKEAQRPVTRSWARHHRGAGLGPPVYRDGCTGAPRLPSPLLSPSPPPAHVSEGLGGGAEVALGITGHHSGTTGSFPLKKHTHL